MRVAILMTDNRDLLHRYADAHPSFGTAPEALLQGFASLRETEVHVVSCTRQPMQSPPRLAANISFHSVVVPKLGWMRTFYQGCIRACRRKLHEIGPDIVHGQGTERDCAISAVFSGFPNVLTIHGNMRLIAKVNRAKPFSFPWLAAKLEAFTLPRADGVVCITSYTREAVAGMAKRTWVVPNAVDAAFFEVQARPVEIPVVLCIGHVCYRKNQSSFIRALDPLAAKYEFRVVFVGPATHGRPYDDEFFQLLQARPWCQYAGAADREGVKSYLQDAAFLALPSLEDNCPMVVLEAMAAGVPVLAGKVGGLPDLIEEGENGLYCDPLDAESMREGVARLLQQPALGQRLAQEAKRRAQARFHTAVVARRHVEIYQDVLGVCS